jgi:hypothetical protein
LANSSKSISKQTRAEFFGSEPTFKVEQSLSLSAHHVLDGNAGRARHD